jgi:hypothetical protein
MYRSLPVVVFYPRIGWCSGSFGRGPYYGSVVVRKVGIVYDRGVRGREEAFQGR